ncbi:hypothetical protein BH23ACT9_BH23ACT9_11220 [soil metagenome]
MAADPDNSPMTQTTDRAPARRGGSTMAGGTMMMVLAIALSWLPIIGPGIAGFVGGRMVGAPGRAFLVALLPAVLLAAVIWLILSAFDLPLLGAIAGFGVAVVIVVQQLPLLIGAWLGGSSARL